MSVPNDAEVKFRDYIQELLSAQNYQDFLGEGALFSPDTLNQTLGEFCNIVAKHLDAESCAITLQLYDPRLKTLKAVNEKHAQSKLKGLVERYAPPDEQKFIDNRRRWIESPLTYPYWFLRKGAAKLLAANENGPWHDASKMTGQIGLAELHSGISKDVFQQNLPTVRDRISIRAARNFRKLGGADVKVWTNEFWERVFRNYYGVPIRIHASGEVVGILKVENKRGTPGSSDSALRSALARLLRPGEPPTKASLYADATSEDRFTSEERDTLELAVSAAHKALESNNPERLFGWLREQIERSSQKTKEDDAEHPPIDVDKLPSASLLALAYLKRDLSQAYEVLGPPESHPPVRDLIFMSYRASTRRGAAGNEASLRPPAGKRPPIQVIMESMAAEKQLWRLLTGDAELPLEQRRRLLDKWYTQLNDAASAVPYAAVGERLGTFLADSLHGSAERVQSDSFLPHFTFGFDVSCGGPDKAAPARLRIYFLVPPKASELPDARPEDHELYAAANAFWREDGAAAFDVGDSVVAVLGPETRLEGRRHGEHIEFDGPRGTLRVTDLALDRLAARLQTFVDALPIPAFTAEDAYRLSWAAFEIGKLIEREIAYRANYHPDDPMPLTAMEFFRIPISGLSWVDDFRGRRTSALVVRTNIDHHLGNMILGNIITNTGVLPSAIEYRSRVKSYRSMLKRIGERYEGYRRGNEAIWFFLLGLIEPRAQTGADPKFAEDLAKFSKSLRDAFEIARLDQPSLPDLRHITDFVDVLRADGGNSVLGDLKFEAPPFAGAPDATCEAVNRLLRTLWCEGMFAADEPPQLEDASPEKLKALIDSLSGDLRLLVLSNYEDFARAASSLLVQLLNLGRHGERFARFYRACYLLRNVLAAPLQDIKNDPQRRFLQEVFGEPGVTGERDQGRVWGDLRRYVDKYDTSAFTGAFVEETRQADLAFMTGRGIYKRLRSLRNVLPHQRSAAALDWDLGRFDLLGARFNCLFKSQMFLVYEAAWRRGDPFLSGNRYAHTQADYVQEPNTTLRARSRTRWLCIRTAVHEGSYNALQIAGLVDPDSIREGYWDEAGRLNLNRVRAALHELFETFDAKAFREYGALAFNRNKIARLVEESYQLAAGLPVTPVQSGRFAYSAILDVLTDVLQYRLTGKEWRRSDGTPLTESVSALLREFLRVMNEMRDGSAEVGRELVGEGNFSIGRLACGALEEGPCASCGRGGTDGDPRCGLYDQARALVDALPEAFGDTSHAKERLEQDERELGRLLDQAAHGPLVSPPLFLGEAERRLREMERRIEELAGASGPDRVEDHCRWLVDTLLMLLRERETYLFAQRFSPAGANAQETDAPQDGDGGLWRREVEEVLWRIKNYTLLFDPTRSKDAVASDLSGLTAYDLYYYVRSLIPIEIQVRTALADTIAEQYHGEIYKGAPSLGAGAAHRHKAIARSIEDLDRALDHLYRSLRNPGTDGEDDDENGGGSE